MVAEDPRHHALEGVAEAVLLGVGPPGLEGLGASTREGRIKVRAQQQLAHARVAVGASVLRVEGRRHHEVARVLFRHGEAARAAGPLPRPLGLRAEYTAESTA